MKQFISLDSDAQQKSVIPPFHPQVISSQTQSRVEMIPEPPTFQTQKVIAAQSQDKDDQQSIITPSQPPTVIAHSSQEIISPSPGIIPSSLDQLDKSSGKTNSSLSTKTPSIGITKISDILNRPAPNKFKIQAYMVDHMPFSTTDFVKSICSRCQLMYFMLFYK